MMVNTLKYPSIHRPILKYFKVTSNKIFVFSCLPTIVIHKEDFITREGFLRKNIAAVSYTPIFLIHIFSKK